VTARTLPTAATVLRAIADALTWQEDGQSTADAIADALARVTGEIMDNDIAAVLREVADGRRDMTREHFRLVDAVNDAATREARAEASRALRDWRDKYGGNLCAADEHTCDRYGIDLGGEDVDGIAICAGVRGDWTPDGFPTYGQIVTRSEVADAS